MRQGFDGHPPQTQAFVDRLLEAAVDQTVSLQTLRITCNNGSL